MWWRGSEDDYDYDYDKDDNDVSKSSWSNTRRKLLTLCKRRNVMSSHASYITSSHYYYSFWKLVWFFFSQVFKEGTCTLHHASCFWSLFSRLFHKASKLSSKLLCIPHVTVKLIAKFRQYKDKSTLEKCQIVRKTQGSFTSTIVRLIHACK